MGRCHSRSRTGRERGSAAVEFILSVTFVFMFALATVDFAKGFAAQTRTLVAARYVAWADGRAYDHAFWGSPQLYKKHHPHWHAEAPDATTLTKLHFHGRKGEVTAASREWEYTIFDAARDLGAQVADLSLGDAGGGVLDDATSEIGGAVADSDFLGMGSKLVSAVLSVFDGPVGRGIPGWGIGTVRGRQADVEQIVPGLRLFGAGTAEAHHYVALYAAPESKPDAHQGWFDFINRAKEWVIEMIQELFP